MLGYGPGAVRRSSAILARRWSDAGVSVCLLPYAQSAARRSQGILAGRFVTTGRTVTRCESPNEDAVRAGVHALIIASYEDLEPIEHASFEITSWAPEPPDETGGARTAQPAAD